MNSERKRGDKMYSARYLRISITGRRGLSTVAPHNLRIRDKQVRIPTGLFINNEFVKSSSGATFGVEDPSTGKELIQIQEGREEDVDIAVKAARAAFESDSWAKSDPVWRGSLLD